MHLMDDWQGNYSDFQAMNQIFGHCEIISISTISDLEEFESFE